MTACHSKDSGKADIASDLSALVQGSILPFKYYGHLYFPVTINNSVQGNFAFDTGADGLYMDSIFFDRSPLARNKMANSKLWGIGNQAQRVKYIPYQYSCQYDSLIMHPSSAYVLNIRPTIGKYLDGVLGIDFLKDSIFAIDYIREQIRILQREKFSTEDYERIPCSIRYNRIFVQASVQITSQKRIEGDFLIDTGSGAGIGVTSHCAKKNRLAQFLPTKVRTYTNWSGIGGPSSSYVAQVEAFHIGNQKIIAPIIDYYEDQQGAMASEDYIGIIGNEILDRFDLIVDIPDNCLYLRPNKSLTLPFHTTFTGFSYVDRTDICDGWVIRALCEGMATEKAGLQIGDVILSINGRKTKEIPFDEQKYFFQKLGNCYMLTVERGKQQFQLILQKVGDYF